MARARGDGSGEGVGVDAGMGVEPRVAAEGDSAVGRPRLAEYCPGIELCEPAREPRDFREYGVKVQLAAALTRRTQPKMPRGPGCCRSPISLLRHDLPVSSSDGG
jgi:hypothetical protein